MELKKIRVPGKVMLSGEYAVMYGAKSVLVPVPRFIEVAEINQSPDSAYSPAVQAALNHRIPEITEFEDMHDLPQLKIDCDQFFIRDKDEIIKLGLGCSAAEAVGVIALRFERAGKPFSKYKEDILKHSLKAHNLAQGGLGSGADIAACAYGVPIKYRIDQGDYQLETITINTAASQLPMNLLWSGKSADTREMVNHFQSWVNKGDSQTKGLLANLIRASNNLADAWFYTSIEDLFDLLNHHGMAMRECALASGIAYEIPIHKEIEHWAERHGGRAKPTGAGGGDMILLLGDLPINELDRIIIQLSDAD